MWLLTASISFGVEDIQSTGCGELDKVSRARRTAAGAEGRERGGKVVGRPYGKPEGMSQIAEETPYLQHY